MATHFYSCSLIPAKPTSRSVLNKYSLFPNPRISTTRHHTLLVSSSSSSSSSSTSSSSFTLRASVSSAATSTAVDGTISSTKPSKSLPFRVGHGFDLHRLEPGYPLIIGGIDIPHDRGCEAHSDGDVLLHCVVDAILGALGLPDIGQIFPDTDPKWKGAPSSVFIKEASHVKSDTLFDVGFTNHDAMNLSSKQPNSFVVANGINFISIKVRLMHEAGYEIGNLDATLILQRPKLSPHKGAIKANLSELLGADPSVVNLKAKTHEKVDSLGENRSIAAHTVVLLMRK